MKPYKPIDCNFYDYIEHFATTGQQIEFIYLDKQFEEVTIQTRIMDTENRGQLGEFILVEAVPDPIRMDRIIAIDGKRRP